MHRTAKYLLQPTKGQSRRLDHLLWMQRILYNAGLEERKNAWATERRTVTRFHQFANLNGMVKTNPDLAQYGATVARGTLTQLHEAYAGFYRRCKAGGTPGYPRFKGQGRWNSVTYQQRGGWKLHADTSRLYLMGVGHIRVRLHRELPGLPKIIHVTREGRRWWVSVVCDQAQPTPLPPTCSNLGIDLGVTCVVTTSNGGHISNGRFTSQEAELLGRLGRTLSRQRSGSRRRKRTVAAIQTVNRRVANRRADAAHKLSRALVNNHDLIVHEDLTIRNMVRRPKPRPDGQGGFEPNGAARKSGLNKSIHDAGWGQLLRFIAYKAEEAGREVIAVDPRNTSRTCSECGHCEKDNRQTQAKFLCLSCGFTMHADENAAINILRAGLALRDAASAAEREVREVAERDLAPACILL